MEGHEIDKWYENIESRTRVLLTAWDIEGNRVRIRVFTPQPFEHWIPIERFYEYYQEDPKGGK